ncbi:MAG: porin family protein [Rubrivivax sp.]|nr:MAG: porin family protein [Rubrivivax sp.]
MDIHPPLSRPPAWLALAACLSMYGATVQAEEPSLLDGPVVSPAQSEAPKVDELWSPRTSNPHVGLSIGKAHFGMPCIEGLVCKRSGKAITVYAGGDFSQRWGFELAYMRMSNLERDGNAVRVKGLNLNLIGELPLSSLWRLTGRIGTNYAWTRMAQAANVQEPTGSARGFGLSYGTGVSVDVAQGWTASADWNRHDFKFVTGRDKVDTATLSLRYRY